VRAPTSHDADDARPAGPRPGPADDSRLASPEDQHDTPAPDAAPTAAPDAEEAPRSGGVVAALRPTLRAAAPALLLYAGIRLFALLALYVFWHRSGSQFEFWQLLDGRFDSGWYQQIADRGYDHAIPVSPNGSLRPTNLAFFPLLPGLIALVTTITPFGSAIAGLVVSWLSCLATAWGLFAIGSQVRDRMTGILLAGLWAVIPHAIVENMAYSESLFAALAAWSLYALLRRNWLLAAVLCVGAGLARPAGSAVIAAVGVTALVAVVRRQDGWRPWVAAIVAPLGYAGYLGWVGLRLGRPDGYFMAQREAWSVTFDGGAFTYHQLVLVLTKAQRLQLTVVTVLLGLAVLLLVLSIVDRHPLPLVVYSLVSLVLVIGAAGAYYGKGRYLVPVFTLLLPVAIGMSRARASTRWIVLAFLACVAAWYGAYLTLIWTASP
jgi:hypothetical protein